MIECHPVWNRTAALLVGNTVRKLHFLAHSNHPIPIATLCQLPEATGCRVSSRSFDGAHCDTSLMAGQKAKVLALDAASSAISRLGDGGTPAAPALAIPIGSTLIRRERRIVQIYACHLPL